MKKTILLVEDEQSIADAIIYSLNEQNYNVLHGKTISQSKELLLNNSIDGIILDINLPDGSGLDLCSELRKTSNMPILFLSARSEVIDKIYGIELGGDDYLAKPFDIRELQARLKNILKRNNLNTTSKKENKQIIKHKEIEVNLEKMQILISEKQVTLSTLEFKILAYLIRQPEAVFSRTQIMEAIWDNPDMSVERTIDTHIKTIRAKIKLIDKNISIIKTHRGFGYSFTYENI